LSNIEVSYAIERSEKEKEIYRLRHVELRKAYDVIEEKNRDITSCINYASRIQNAMLPRQQEVRGLSGRSFILYIPKDIVSGDFFWFTSLDGKIIIAAGDCTGHGVPGALMSMLGISFLEEIVNSRKIINPGNILDELRAKVRKALHQRGQGEEAKDGMDLSLCVLDKKTRIILYSGAYNNLYHISDHHLTEYNADRMPIGIHDTSDKNFSFNQIQAKCGDLIYMFSDGYADQFGGRDQKKFKYTAFRNLLLEIHDQPLSTQKRRLESEFYKWKGNNPQTDDVTVIGIRI
jgi:serine phosphatase RsbU (regulator of sigma subunit)